jgi:hypothetical protein
VTTAADDAALDALALALAPRLLREIRLLIRAEAGDNDAEALAILSAMGYQTAAAAAAAAEERALGVATLESMGYVVGGVREDRPSPPRDRRKPKKRKPKRKPG